MAVTDLMKVSNFILQFKDQTPLELMITGVNIPGFTLGTVSMNRPTLVDKRPGDSLTYSDLSVTVLCDEDLKAYKEIYRYLVLAADPHTGRLEIKKTVFDANLFLTTNKNNVKHKLKFYNCFINSVSDIQMESSSSEEEQITFTLGLQFTFFDFVEL
jgi:hypothetical protein